jgi:ribonuclease VapC
VIVDSSALIAILAGEPDADKLNDILSSAARPALSVANYLEAAIVLDRHRARGAGERLDRYLVVAQVEFAWSPSLKPASPALRIETSERPPDIRPVSTLATALHTRSPSSATNRCSQGDDFKHTDIRSALSA